MTVRIEEARAIAFLKELPSGWAQMCITSPTPRCPESEAIAVLAEVHRVPAERGISDEVLDVSQASDERDQS